MQLLHIDFSSSWSSFVVLQLKESLEILSESVTKIRNIRLFCFGLVTTLVV